MARIPDDQLERIKQEVSLLRLAESQGYKGRAKTTLYAARSTMIKHRLVLLALKAICLTALAVVRVAR